MTPKLFTDWLTAFAGLALVSVLTVMGVALMAYAVSSAGVAIRDQWKKAEDKDEKEELIGYEP